MTVTVGVLALQGGFHEHVVLLQRAAQQLQAEPAEPTQPIETVEVRTPSELARCDALIVPGGESTTMALIAAQSGLLEPLRDFVRTQKKPTWGTCAGLILLAREATAAKKGGQALVGGLDVRVHRNYFGRQVESFVADLDLPFLQSDAPFPGVFIRAPVVEALLPRADGGVEVEVLAVLPGRTQRAKGGRSPPPATPTAEANDIVAVRQGNVLGTSFHPELTDDVRLHAWWLRQVLQCSPCREE